MLSTHVFFAIQVSPAYPAWNYRSNDPFLVLLPCPQRCKQLLIDCVHAVVNLLELCGDVETNPGPSDTNPASSDTQLILQLITGQKEIAKGIQEVKVAQTSMEQKMSSFEKRLETFETTLGTLKELKEKMVRCETQTSHLERHVIFLQGKIDDLENRGRRNNLIIHGMEELPDESTDSLHDQLINGVFRDRLGISITGVERCHRLGRKVADKARPVILKLIDFREKLSVLKNCRKLKGSKIFVTEDFSLRVREIRRHLWGSTAVNRANKEKVKLIYDKAVVNGKVYTWDQSTKRVLEQQNEIRD
ncbi:uncharacterized protein LOC121047579 [Ixodes scapularis]|uniref:uncharacterized protein LOC121047579 n=1 Tax=Ixodes scapularis TaxID=6945 RepID=UPI001C387FBE|nr:uncharacterized protein LOC121047579 [Ixodes scapularis]